MDAVPQLSIPFRMLQRGLLPASWTWIQLSIPFGMLLEAYEKGLINEDESFNSFWDATYRWRRTADTGL